MSDRKLMLDDPAAYYMQLGREQESKRIIKLLENHKWFEKGEQDEILGILNGSYECECSGCIALIKGEQND